MSTNNTPCPIADLRAEFKALREIGMKVPKAADKRLDTHRQECAEYVHSMGVTAAADLIINLGRMGA